MKFRNCIIIFLFFFFGIISTAVAQIVHTATAATSVKLDQKIRVYDFDAFEHILNYKDDKIYIINFWATWCKPCIKEIPDFETISKKYKDQNVEVILVSLDFPEKIESHVIPFMRKNALHLRVVLLDDTDSNTWIPKVSEIWSGAIPATIIYSNKSRIFHEGSLTFDELEKKLKPFLK